MRFLSSPEIKSWCEQNRIPVNDFELPDRSGAELRFKIPADAQKRVVLVNGAMKSFDQEPVILVWFDDWSVWPSGQRMHVFERFRKSYGESRPLIEAPGQLFDRTELEDACSFVTIALLFLWDCYVVTPGVTK